MDRSKSRDIIRELDGCVYASFGDLENGLLGAFNKHLDEMPPNYTYRQLIRLAEERGWVRQSQGQFHIQVTG
jgi:hypothetical protein